MQELDINVLFKELVGDILENGLEAELDDELGYSKYDYRNKDTDNSRNGHSTKRMKTSFGEVGNLAYITNAIEGFNRQLRNVTKSKSVFPTDDSLLKMLYLAMMDIINKWTGKRLDWGVIHSSLLQRLCKPPNRCIIKKQSLEV